MNSSAPEGSVMLDGVEWQALLDEQSLELDVGEFAKIVSYESIVLTVKKA